MLFNAIAKLVVGSMGWIDKGSLWTFDPLRRVEKTIAIEDASHLSLRTGTNDLFRLVHHGSPSQNISIRSFAEPDVALASVEIANGAFCGDLSLWQHVDPTAVVNTEHGQKLVVVDAQKGKITNLDLAWYSNENYDLDYQGLTDCMFLAPDQVIVSVQRSSDLIVMNLDRNARVGTIPLAGRDGNPMLSRRTEGDFFVSDYDTYVDWILEH